jgi:hypothetical protein
MHGMGQPRRAGKAVKFADCPIGARVAIIVPMHDGVGGKEVRQTFYERTEGPGRFFPERNLAAIRLRTRQGEGASWRYDTGWYCHLTELPTEQLVTLAEDYDGRRADDHS